MRRRRKKFVISKQLKRSGAAPGALVRESKYAENKKDFIHNMSIGLKEANETEYWIELAYEGGYISETLYSTLKEDCIEIVKIMTSIIKTSKQRL